MNDYNGFFDTPEIRAKLLAEARALLGAPFMLNGRSKDGMGCAGLPANILETLGATPHLDLPRGNGCFGAQFKIRRMSDWMASQPYFFEIDPADVDVGDIVTFKTVTGEYHMGLWLGLVDAQERSILHAHVRFGVSMSNLFDPTYEDRLVAVWRVQKGEH